MSIKRKLRRVPSLGSNWYTFSQAEKGMKVDDHKNPKFNFGRKAADTAAAIAIAAAESKAAIKRWTEDRKKGANKTIKNIREFKKKRQENKTKRKRTRIRLRDEANQSIARYAYIMFADLNERAQNEVKVKGILSRAIGESNTGNSTKKRQKALEELKKIYNKKDFAMGPYVNRKEKTTLLRQPGTYTQVFAEDIIQQQRAKKQANAAAASKIQALQRGRLTRKKIAESKAQEPLDGDEGVIVENASQIEQQQREEDIRKTKIEMANLTTEKIQNFIEKEYSNILISNPEYYITLDFWTGVDRLLLDCTEKTDDKPKPSELYDGLKAFAESKDRTASGYRRGPSPSVKDWSRVGKMIKDLGWTDQDIFDKLKKEQEEQQAAKKKQDNDRLGGESKEKESVASLLPDEIRSPLVQMIKVYEKNIELVKKTLEDAKKAENEIPNNDFNVPTEYGEDGSGESKAITQEEKDERNRLAEEELRQLELELDNENEPISVAAATAADISKTLAKTENETRITRINKKIEEIKKLDEMIQKKPGTKNKNIPLRDQHLIITEDLINKLDNPVPQSIQRWKNENNEKIERAHTAEKLRRKKRIEKRRRERGTPPPRRTRSHRLTKKSHIGGRKKNIQGEN